MPGLKVLLLQLASMLQIGLALRCFVCNSLKQAPQVNPETKAQP
jgi:hypothetical protein